jgi:hypothetical protein
MKIDFITEAQFEKLLEKQNANEYIQFFCGPGGCPFIKTKCEPDLCGNYYRYKANFFGGL